MSLNFSGHQTFPLRQLWPFKATQLLATIDKPFTKDIHQSMMNMGLGKNMVQSMSHWMQSSDLIKANYTGEYSLSPLAKILLNNTKGDPYLERIETLWIIHQRLCTNKKKNSTFYWLYNLNNNMVFSFDDYKRGIRLWYEKEDLNLTSFPADKTLKNDFNVTVGMYTQGTMKDFEDSVQFPFWPLGLIKRAHGLKQNYQLIKRSVCDVPSSVFNFVLIDYLSKSLKTEAVSFDNLLNDANSPGRVLQLSEHPLRVYLENVEKELKGAYTFDDTAGQRLLYIKNSLDSIEYLKKAYR